MGSTVWPKCGIDALKTTHIRIAAGHTVCFVRNVHSFRPLKFMLDLIPYEILRGGMGGKFFLLFTSNLNLKLIENI